jgi:hypothetical protein
MRSRLAMHVLACKHFAAQLLKLCTSGQFAAPSLSPVSRNTLQEMAWRRKAKN